MFIDEIKISVQSGRGGAGIVHFRREKYVPMGGPDGGDGGRGGDVVFQVEERLNTLSAFRRRHQYHAQNGFKGGGNNKFGKSGEDLLLLVPPGTLVYDDDTDELLGDLTDSGQTLMACEGGRGGRGNSRFASSTNKAPRIAEKGEPATERNLRLELKLIADIGLVGVPNAGKSTLLASVTNAKPKIAAYPFTTLQPNLGVVHLDIETTLVLADIPGLIEGAHQGVGLGHEFLRHIQRTRVLIHLIDGLALDPILDFAQINSELALFDPQLAEKPQIVVFNKMDLVEVQEQWPDIKAELEKRGYEAYAISAVAGTDVRKVLYRAQQLLDDLPPMPVLTSEDLPIYRPESDPREFEVERIPKGFLVTGESIERAAAMTYWEFGQSVRRFQRILQVLGIEDALIKKGVQVGDSVFIGEYELEWAE
ncbi:MAG: GTPase ObgE [Anaerolineales bacterium]|nr:GTPase ObgE [Chloroflexota bacterium]MBL6982222.1 GTPase ObgE [Anaerolineales bacterium]